MYLPPTPSVGPFHGILDPARQQGTDRMIDSLFNQLVQILRAQARPGGIMHQDMIVFAKYIVQRRYRRQNAVTSLHATYTTAKRCIAPLVTPCQRTSSALSASMMPSISG